MSRPFKNTPLQIKYDKLHEQLRRELSVRKKLKPRYRVKAKSRPA